MYFLFLVLNNIITTFLYINQYFCNNGVLEIFLLNCLRVYILLIFSVKRRKQEKCKKYKKIKYIIQYQIFLLFNLKLQMFGIFTGVNPI